MLLGTITFRDDLEISLCHGTTSDHEDSFRERIRIYEPKRRTIRDFGTGVFRKSKMQRNAADLCIGTANTEDYDDFAPDSAFRNR